MSRPSAGTSAAPSPDAPGTTASCYYSYNDYIGRFRPGGPVEEVVTDLPGRGDHQPSPPTFGPDDKLYFSTGSATNCGVVGADNIAYEWLRNPDLQDVCDIPGEDVVLPGGTMSPRT